MALAGVLAVLSVTGGCGTIPDSFGKGPLDPAVETCEYVESGQAARPVRLPPTDNVPRTGSVTFVLKMTEGDVTITMDREKAPCTVNSFRSLAEQGYFDRTRCHRLVDSGAFFLQCGDPTGKGDGGPGYQFDDETDPSDTYPAGTVAMANGGVNSNGSQFFLVYDDSELPPNYTVFGKMDQPSTDVVARMSAEGEDGRYRASGGGGGRPNNPSEIISVVEEQPADLSPTPESSRSNGPTPSDTPSGR
nr:peptidylprolyl isomerase [Microlunatus panaciterrae]